MISTCCRPASASAAASVAAGNAYGNWHSTPVKPSAAAAAKRAGKAHSVYIRLRLAAKRGMAARFRGWAPGAGCRGARGRPRRTAPGRPGPGRPSPGPAPCRPVAAPASAAHRHRPQRPLQRRLQRKRRGLAEGEAGLAIGHGVGQAADTAHHRHGAVAQAVELGQAAGLEARGHEDHVGPGDQPVRPALVVAHVQRHGAGVGVARRSQRPIPATGRPCPAPPAARRGAAVRAARPAPGPAPSATTAG